jgi:signal transduction histidine kinase
MIALMRVLSSWMMQGFCGLRCRLLILVLIACAPLIFLTANKAGEDRRRQETAWRQRSVRLSELAQREEQKLIGQTRQLLLAVAESGHVRAGDRRNTRKLMDQLFSSYPRYANLGVVRTNGELVASALPVTNLFFPDQEFFRRVLDRHDFSIGSLMTGTNGAMIYFGYPVLDNNGEMLSVVFAALDWPWFARFGSEFPGQLPKGATWTEIDQHGRILVRHPNPEAWIGKPFAERHVLLGVTDTPATVLQTTNAQGIQTVYGIALRPSELAGGTATALLSIPRPLLFAESDRILYRTLSWMGLALGVALLLGWLGSNLLVIRPVKALARASARLATGDLRTRTGLPHGRDELGQLTAAFDQMAEALEQRELEKQRNRDKLQILSHRLVEVQETERRHIARELHDEIGQTLTVAEMNLQAARQSVPSETVDQRLVDSIQAVERVQEQVRDLSLNLRPSMLDDLGLEPALRWYLNRQATAANLECRFRADPLDGRLEPIVETECFRVAQEALTNILRHAGASTVQLDLRKKDNQLHLHVKDDGIGFDVAAMKERAARGVSLGLLSMEERTSLAGGGLEFYSAPGRGTEVHAWFPLRYRPVPVEIVA